MEPSIAQQLVGRTAALQWDDMPRAVQDKAKLLLLDTLGVAIAAVPNDYGKAARALVGGWGGAGGNAGNAGHGFATMIGSGQRATAHHAALYNGIIAHGEDYDDTHTAAVVHASAALVPAVLAAAEANGASGRATLVALALAAETAIRVALPANNGFHLRGFHTTAVTTPFGAALAAARLRGLDAAGQVNALGIAGSFASGLLECVPAAAGSKRLHAGWASANGLIAADFAAAGTTGPASVFDGKFGLYNAFLRGQDIDTTMLVDGLGMHWHMLDLSPKLYPACHYVQAFLDAAKVLRDRGARPADVARIDCRIAQGGVNIVCEPWASKITPKTGYDTRFSLPFAVASMLVTGKGGAEQFSDAACQDPDIVALMRKIQYSVDPAYLVKEMPAALDITLNDGRVLAHEIRHGRGDAAHPIPRAELVAKFEANTAALGAGTSATLSEMIDRLDQLDDIGALLRAIPVIPA